MDGKTNILTKGRRTMLRHTGTQPLETGRLILRRFEKADAQAMFENWANDAEGCRYMTWEPHGEVENTKSLLEGWVAAYESDSQYNWAIVLKETGEPIGSLGLVSISERGMWGEVGYCLSRRYWNQGLMTEALLACLSFCFLQVGFNRIQAKHHVDNPASGAVMRKAGMKYEGLLHEILYKESLGFCNCEQYYLLRRDYGAAE